MDNLDQHRKKRLEQLIAAPPYNGDRTAFIKKAKLTKGRISQLLDPKEAFGERAAKSMALSLGLSDTRWFDKGLIEETTPWPFIKLTPEEVLSLSPEHLATVEKVASDLLKSMNTLPKKQSATVDTGASPNPPFEYVGDESKVETDGERDRVEASKPKRGGS